MPQATFTANVLYTYIAICIERAYSSYRIGRHKYLDVYNAYRPVIYTWLATCILNILPLILDGISSTLPKNNGSIILPACHGLYIQRWKYVVTNETEPDRKSFASLARTAIPLAAIEFIPLFLFLYIERRNRRLLNNYTAERTHE